MANNKLLHTDLMLLMGGKNGPAGELIPPVDPPFLSKDGFNPEPNRPELVNTAVDEVLNHPPHWLLRWGTTLFFFVLLVILAVSWFVKYPDLVGGALKVLPGNQPRIIISRSEGRLEKLLVKDNQAVEKGQHLAYIESTAAPEDVLLLEQTLNDLMQESIESIYKADIPIFFNLGELQKTYQSFQEAFIRSKAASASGTFSKRKGVINQEISSLRSLRDNTYEQLAIQERDIEMAREEAESQQRLADKGFVSALEAKNAMSRYLSKKQAYEQAKASLVNNSLSQTQKRQELLEMDKTIEEHQINLLQTIYSLKSDIEAWKQRYIAIAPDAGRVHFIDNIQENQLLRPGDEIMVVAPPIDHFSGEMWVGQYNFGKIKEGQEVIVKFDSYPYQQYGTVMAQIGHIGEIPRDTATLINIVFPNGLTTNSGQTLDFKYGMMASGEIITEDLRLLERFFYDIRKMLKQ